MAAKKHKVTLEQALLRLEEIAALMENADTPLEQSLELYKEGMTLAVDCAERLENARQQVAILKEGIESEFKE